MFGLLTNHFVMFCCRYENELNMRLSVEADIANLKRVREDLIHAHQELTAEISSLNEDLVFLKKSHDEV